MNTAGTRAILRIARRNIGRSRWRSALIAVLIMLPVAAMVGATAVMIAVTPTAEQSASHQMGRADLLVYPSGEGASVAALQGVLPPGSRIEPFVYGEDHLVLTGMEASVTVRSLDLQGLAHGMVSLLSGRTPADGSEVAISQAVSALAGVGIGDRTTLKGLGTPTVVGLVEDSFDLQSRFILVDGSAARTAPDDSVTWLVGLPSGTDPGSLDWSSVTGPTGSLFAVTTRTNRVSAADQASPTIIVLGGLAMVEVALVASAAFAVSVRRRQRELGLMAAAGASPRHLAGTVLAEGLLLGVLGSLAGIVVGLLAAEAFSPWLDQLTDRRTPPISLSPTWIGMAAGIGLIANLLAALAPAWTAARVPVTTALSGRRPPSTPARRTLAFGVALIGIAIGLTLGGSALRLRDGGNPLSIPMLLLGAVGGTLGFGACSPWLVERLERPARFLPLASRIALRDTARARSRNGPIITAILASFAATVALAAYATSLAASNAAHWQPYMQSDQIYLQGNVDEAGPDVAEALGAVAAAPIPGIGSEGQFPLVTTGNGATRQQFGYVTVGDAELLKVLHAEDAVTDLQDGSVVLLPEKPLNVSTATVEVTDAQGTVVSTTNLPARVVAIGLATGALPQAVVSAETARRLGLGIPANGRYLLRLSRDVTDADLAKAAEIAGGYPDTFADAALPPHLAGEGFRIVMLVASLLLALSVTGVAVALGEAESRPEQRTLLALGAHPQLRRWVAAGRAGSIALLAGVLAVPAGLLPVWGLFASRNAPLVVPVPEVLAAVIALPVLAIVGTLLLSRPIPSWSAFRDLAR
ncbi:MAG: FtsX-like permease family protein [Chloroflexota bacterium]